jgi:hypothetical protein
LNSFAEMEMLLRNITLDLHGSGIAPNNVMTEYEMKFSGQGMSIHRCEAIVGARAMERRRAELRELRARWENRGDAEDEGESDDDADLAEKSGTRDGAKDASVSKSSPGAESGLLAELSDELVPSMGARPHSRDRHAGSIVRVTGVRPLGRK